MDHVEPTTTTTTTTTATWRIDASTLQRLWPVIDVHGRIEDALRVQRGTRPRRRGVFAVGGSAA